MNFVSPFLYIDPGTGSMLFSILIGATATLFFLGKAAILKLKVFFSGKKGGTIVDSTYKDYVIWNEGRQYVTLFLPILEEFEKREINVTYYTSYKDDPAFTANYKFITSEYIGEKNTAFTRLNLLSAGFVLMTTPGLDVYQLKRSKGVKHYSHLIHGTSDATIYRLFGLDFFDSVLLTGDYQKNGIRYLEKKRSIKEKELVTVGLPYLDVLQKKLKSIPKEENHNFTVLLSPSWGKSSLLTKYGEKLIDPLLETSWKIIIRPHPQSKISEKDMLSRLEERYKDKQNIEWNYDQDNIYCLKKADVMISDFSGIIFDYAYLLERPIFYANADFDLKPYDAYWLPNNGKDEWTFQTLKKIGVDLREEDFSNIKQIIENASTSEERIKACRRAKEEAWMYIGESAKRVVDFMVKTVAAL